MAEIELPIFLKTALKYQLSENAVLSAVPFLLYWIFSIFLGLFFSGLENRSYMSRTNVRKLANGMGSGIPIICYTLLCTVELNRTFMVIVKTVAITSMSCHLSGFNSNHIDIAPSFAGTLVALTNSTASITGIIIPFVVAQFTHKDVS